ncbi:MAG TPA: ABC transporter [Ornithinimicrobium sp.]|uniref:ABC transporter permease n=1 Tax=Ornithinimicrobium sp. TaxID=1977084 RepID=UPI002B4AA9AC|nr:ABC transporter [Ornithinimicrobium sp.]HKJ11174.1 ABC transporter [Ornithinimicrobium sp.]
MTRLAALLAAGLTAAVLVLSILTLVLTATGLMPLVGTPGATLRAFDAVRGDLLLAVRESLVIATSSTVLAGAIGMSVALVALASPGGSRLLAATTTAPVPVAHIVAAVSFALLLSDAGLANRLSGLDTASWPPLVAGPWPVASVATFAWKESAFVALVVTASLGPAVRDYSEVAALLGAGWRERVRYVLLPLALPALGAACAIVFLFTLGSYEVVWLLGQAYPEPLPVTAYRLFTSLDLQARPQAAAVALTTVGLAMAAAVASVGVLRRSGVSR